MKKLITACCTCALLALTSCSSYSLLNSEVLGNADLASYHTFRIVTPDEGKLPPGMSMVSYYNIAAAIREQMVDRGYVEDPNSVLMINIGLTVNSELVNVPYTNTVSTTVPAVAPAPAPAPAPGPGGPVGPGGPGGPGPGPRPYFIYPRTYYTTYTQWVPTIYKEGVLTIDMVNTAEKRALFTASVGTILDNGDSQLQSLSGIAKAVQVLFSKYPVPIIKPTKNN